MLEPENFSFPFDDRDWSNKFIIGSLLHLIAPFLLYLPIAFPRGYSLRVWRDAVRGLPARLTEWDNWEKIGLEGLAYYAVMLLYSLPVWLMWGAVVVLAVVGGLGVGWIAEVGEAEGAAVLGSLVLAVGLGLVALLAALVSLAFGLFYPVAVGRYLEEDGLGAAFEIGAVWRILRANLGGWFVAWLVVLVLNLVIGSVVSLLSTLFCWIPFLSYLLMAPGMFYTSLVQARLMGLAYHKAKLRLAKEDASEEMPGDEPESAETVREAVVSEVSLEEVETAQPIEALGLSARVRGVLQGAGLISVDQILARLADGDEALLSIRGIGPKSLGQIKTCLVDGGYL